MRNRMIVSDALYDYIVNKARPSYIKNVDGTYSNVGDFLINLSDLRDKINELATPAPEPHQSIFDADGWCWDMDLTPITIVGVKIKFFDILVAKKYHTGTQNEFKQNERIANVWLDDYLKLRDSTQEKLNVADIAVLAWRPIPIIPKEDK